MLFIVIIQCPMKMESFFQFKRNVKNISIKYKIKSYKTVQMALYTNIKVSK